MSSEQNKVETILDAVQFLERVVEVFCTKIGPPLYIDEKEKERFRYPQPTPIIVQVLKAVRVVSGLNALVYLLERGFVQEMGVLLRTTEDFLKEISFVQEGIETEPFNESQKKFIEQFFSDDLQTPEEYLTKEKPKRVEHKKVVASQVRLLGKFGEPERIRLHFLFDHDIFSGFVHGAYPQIMEMYEGGTERFRMKGEQSVARIKSFRGKVASGVMRSICIFGHIANNLQLRDLFGELVAKSQEFAKSDVYQEWRKEEPL